MNKLSKELYPDVYHKYKTMSEAKQQADVDQIPRKRWASGVCSSPLRIVRMVVPWNSP